MKMKVYLSMLMVASVAISATLGYLSDNELKEAMRDVDSKIGSKHMDVLDVLLHAFVECDRKHRGLEYAMSKYMYSNANVHTLWRWKFKKSFKMIIGEACSAFIRVVSEYESDYEHLKAENPEYKPNFYVDWYFKGLKNCRRVTQNMDYYSDKTYDIV